MKNMRIIWFSSVLFLFQNSPVSAIEPLICRNGFFPKGQQALKIAEVLTPKGEKLYFFEDEEVCPSDAKKCKKKSYIIITADNLIINSVKEGWVNASSLKFMASDSSPDNFVWLGNWKFYDNNIKISQIHNKMQAVGDAFSYGAVVAGERVIHTGELGGELGELRVNATHARLAVEPGQSRYIDFFPKISSSR